MWADERGRLSVLQQEGVGEGEAEGQEYESEEVV